MTGRRWQAIFLSILLNPLQCTVSRSCVAVDNEEYQCTDDPLQLVHMKDRHALSRHKSHYNLGLAQRIDGNESEKKAIVEVLARMDDYFLNEVLAQPEYENVRSRW